MKSNFEYLNRESKYKSFVPSCLEAEKLVGISYTASATFARKAMEMAVRWVYTNDEALSLPYNDKFAALIHNYDFKDLVGEELFRAINFTRELGNKAVHTQMPISRNQAVLSLRNLFNFTAFIDYCYSKDYEERTFDETILGQDGRTHKNSKEDQEFKKILKEKQKSLEDLIAENQKLREENQNIRKENEKARSFNPDTLSEKETRKAYIDLDLELKGWVFGKNCLEEVKISHMTSASGLGFVDYVLYGDNGKPLALVEAKQTSINPKNGKNQAKFYADALEVETGQRPVIFYTNGLDYYIWDDRSYPERRVSGIYSKEDLESLIFIRENKKSLKNPEINDDITNRGYQKEAIKRCLEDFEAGRRKALLVMATGSGKTRTAASLVDILVRKNWIKNILFLADRTALVKQAKQAFGQYLPNLSLCNLLDSKDDANSRMVFSTYPSIMNAIDEKKTPDGKSIFTNGHFDLIILDESHRSIYRKYRDIFDYFDAKMVGLTATPVDEIDRNTYRIFEREDGNPTFAYTLKEAIEKGYLLDYKLPKVSETRIMKSGIVYDDLSPEEKEKFEDTFGAIGNISHDEINKSLFNEETVDIVLNEVMRKGLKIEGGDKLGKTIIFAANRNHADFIVQRFDQLYPEYKGDFAEAIYHDKPYVDGLIDRFKDKNSYPQIAVSVDMLDTGIDVPEIVNLVFFKIVRSKAKFWQMIGRGTRLCPDLFGPGLDKEYFLIFDYCYNFDYFKIPGNGYEGKIQRSLTESIFNIKIDLIKSIREKESHDEDLEAYMESLVEDCLSSIRAINTDRFSARMRIGLLDKYKNKENFNRLNELDVKNLKDEIAPLLISTDQDEYAKRFDLIVYKIEYALVSKKSFTYHKNLLKDLGRELRFVRNIDQVKKNLDLIDELVEETFWDDYDILRLEKMRLSLRDLMKLIVKEKPQVFYTDFKDDVLGYKVNEPVEDSYDTSTYKERVEAYFKNYKDDLSIYKLRNNKELTKSDLRYFEKVLFEDLGDEKSYHRTYEDQPLMKMISSIVGMEREAVNQAFSKFLTDESLNSDQIDFVKNIVEYIVKNGSMDKTELNSYLFSKNGSISDLFENRLDIAREISYSIDKINDRLII